MFVFIFTVCTIIGYFIGIHVSLLYQAITVAGIIAFLFMPWINNLELEALLYYAGTMFIIVGIIIGNIVYLAFHDWTLSINITKILTGS